MSGRRLALYIDPPSHHFLGDRLFDADAAPYVGDKLMAPYVKVKERLAARGIPVHTADYLKEQQDGTLNIYVSTGRLGSYAGISHRSDTVLSAFFAFECPINDPELYRGLRGAQRYFKRIFSWSDSASLERFVGAPLQLEHFFWPQSFDRVHEEIWRNGERKFVVMMNNNKTPAVDWQSLHLARLRAVAYFAAAGEIDLYGREWDLPPYRVGKTHVPYTIRRLRRQATAYWQKLRPDPLLVAARSVWRGPTVTKAATLGQYTFAICFENMILAGWITEKIFDCFFAGTVPIYWGAPEVDQVIPPDSFVDMRQFKDYPELGRYLRSLSKNDIRRYKECGRAFVESPGFYPWSRQAFADLFVRIIEEDSGVILGRKP